MTDLIFVGLNSWIIEDGNYDELEVGQSFACALEYWAQVPLIPSRLPVQTARFVKDTCYEVSGRVLHSANDWHVIDVGFPIYWDEQPAPFATDQFFTGQIGLGVDPFFYFERRALEPDAPPLISDWIIRSIERQTAPFVETGPRTFERDMKQWGWEAVQRTTVFNGLGEDYRLGLQRQPGTPRHTLKPYQPNPLP